MAVEKKSSAKNFAKMVVVGVERRLKRERLEEEREREGLLLMSSHQRLCWVIFLIQQRMVIVSKLIQPWISLIGHIFALMAGKKRIARWKEEFFDVRKVFWMCSWPQRVDRIHWWVDKCMSLLQAEAWNWVQRWQRKGKKEKKRNLIGVARAMSPKICSYNNYCPRRRRSL